MILFFVKAFSGQDNRALGIIMDSILWTFRLKDSEHETQKWFCLKLIAY